MSTAEARGGAGPSPMTDATRRCVEAALANGLDETNPAFLFSITASSLLLAIAHGLIDPVALARQTLADRGIDADGEWIGFEQARRVWGVTR